MRFLHLTDNANARPENKTGKGSSPAKKPLSLTSEKYIYMPTQYLSSDESVIQIKGRLGWVQYMTIYPMKWGIKIFAPSETNTGSYGDRTTKYHKKYQGFQVSLPDGSSHTMCLTEMAKGDTELGTMNAFKARLQELAGVLSTDDTEGVYNELICSFKSNNGPIRGPGMPPKE